MTSAPQQIVIVGGGIAGVTAASALRDTDFEGRVTIVGAEVHRAYSRPALSKAALLDLEDLSSHVLPDAGHGAVELLGVSAEGLDTAARRISLDNGEMLEYDGLIVANGSHARRLGQHDYNSTESAELTLRTLEDAAELRRRLATKPSVTVIGGGPLAMEIASGCVAASCEVTLITRRVPQSALLGEHLAEFLTARAADAGVHLLQAAHITVDDHGTHAIVTLVEESGEPPSVLESSLVITAIGDDPAIAWLADSGLAIDDSLGLLTDQRGRLRPDIVAAGDIAAYPFADGHRRLPLWTSAIEQGKVAAQALLLGDEAPKLELQPYFWTEQWGIGIKACGELPVIGSPEVLQGDLAAHSALLRWGDAENGTATAVSVGMRMPIPRLRAHTRPVVAA